MLIIQLDEKYSKYELWTSKFYVVYETHLKNGFSSL